MKRRAFNQVINRQNNLSEKKKLRMRCKKQPFRDDASASSIHYFSSRDCLLVSSMKFDGK